jgi:hypothetical protein
VAFRRGGRNGEYFAKNIFPADSFTKYKIKFITNNQTMCAYNDTIEQYESDLAYHDI